MPEGKQPRDYLSIEAVAENFILALSILGKSGVINCSSGSPISVLDLAREIYKECGSNIHLNTGALYSPRIWAFKFLRCARQVFPFLAQISDLQCIFARIYLAVS